MTTLRDSPELQPYVLKDVERTGKIIGSGSFGTVEELVYDHALCAGKIIHDALLYHHEGPSYHLKKFVQESKILKELRYPHIVQFMGLYFTDNSNYPVIVMELLDNSVEQWLKNNPKEMPMSLKTSILQDVAKGIHFLHTRSPPIIHRDITAGNILLTKSMRAKVADLGNAHIISAQIMSKTLSRAPGTTVYMPPEAFEIHAKYNTSLDIFSFGHLALYTILQKSPHELLMATYPDPKNLEKTLGRSEVERRKFYFDALQDKCFSDHKLTIMIKSCLCNNPALRPPAKKVIEILRAYLHDNHDDYQEYTSYNVYDFARKIQEERDYQEPTQVHDSEVGEIKAKIKGGEGFILQLFRQKQAIFRRTSGKWKRFTFYCTSDTQTLQYYGDLNKPSIQGANLSTIENITKMKEISFGFRVNFKGRDSWLLRANNKEERAAWMEVLKPGSSKEAPTFTPPSPPRENEDDDSIDYEKIPAIGEAYETINLGSRQHDVSVYTNPTMNETKPKPTPKPRRLFRVQKVSSPEHLAENPESQGVNPDSSPKINITDVTTNDGVSEAPPRQRNSVGFSNEQMELLFDMMQQFGYRPNDEPSISQPSDSTGAESLYEPPLEEDIYDTIDDVIPEEELYSSIYDRIPPLPLKLRKQQMNIDERENPKIATLKGKPALPPKPALLPKPTNKLSVMSSRNSIDDLLRTSSQVSTKMLILEDEDYGTIHRPDWAKASITPTFNKDLEKSKKDDEILNLLSLSPQSIHNLVEVASGEFGKVYRATLMMSYGEEMDVAVKTVKYKTEKEEKNFLREMNIMSKMIHPNLVRLCGLVMEENWIVLEYLHNGDLGSFLKKNYRPIKKLLKYMMDVAIGMHYISNLGLVHRDLAARNILLGPDETCKVADFGLIREIEHEFYRDSVTTRLPVRWCAPESLTDRKFYPASDVWSYGVLLWEMANPTEIPYEQYDNNQFAIKISHGETLDIPLEYPQTVKEIMIACWQLKPGKRPSFMLISTLLTNENFRGRGLSK